MTISVFFTLFIRFFGLLKISKCIKDKNVYIWLLENSHVVQSLYKTLAHVYENLYDGYSPFLMVIK